MSTTATLPLKVRRRRKLYWLIQLIAWLGYGGVLLFFLFTIDNLTRDTFIGILLIVFIGIGLSHFYRFIILRLKWKTLRPLLLIPRVLIASLLFGITLYLLNSIILYYTFHLNFFTMGEAFSQFLHWSFLCMVWSLFYFAFHLFEKGRAEELRSLQVEANAHEVELNNLKTQLNPHFMFNAMNSIRALVDEEPELAKKSITQLSNILRSTLLMGRKKLVAVQEELKLVKDYLLLEGIRFEERLQVKYEVDKGVMNYQIPPLMLQTIVENAIKHGISNLRDGGLITIRIAEEGHLLLLRVENSGKLLQNDKLKPGTGTGLENTKKRLRLMYGEAASFSIYDEDNRVVAEVRLPKDYKV